MLHPVGNQAPTVYWRRRLAFVAAALALVALIAVTVHVVLSKDPSPQAAGISSSSSPGQSSSLNQSGRQSSPATSHPAPHSTPPSASHSTSSSPAPSPTTSGSSSAAPMPCSSKGLAIAAVTSSPTYGVGKELTLSLQVTNIGLTACTQNLADSQIVLQVYNGVSRVWGSHDCQIAPGTDVRTLGVNMPVRISVIWSGRSSQAKCAGLRQQVGAGTYTLYAWLSGQEGKAAQFAIK